MPSQPKTIGRIWRDAVAAYGVALNESGLGASYAEVACAFLPDLDRILDGVDRALAY